MGSGIPCQQHIQVENTAQLRYNYFEKKEAGFEQNMFKLLLSILMFIF